jgi:hypothetical protein
LRKSDAAIGKARKFHCISSIVGFFKVSFERHKTSQFRQTCNYSAAFDAIRMIADDENLDIVNLLHAILLSQAHSASFLGISKKWE